MRKAQHAQAIGNILVKFRLESLNHRHHLEDGRVILKCTLKKWVGRCGFDSSSLLQDQIVGSCEHGREVSGHRISWLA
jgi:hypothetical protein